MNTQKMPSLNLLCRVLCWVILFILFAYCIHPFFYQRVFSLIPGLSMDISVENLTGEDCDLWLARHSTNDVWIRDYAVDSSSSALVEYKTVAESGKAFDYLSARSIAPGSAIHFSPTAEYFNIHLNFQHPGENGGYFRVSSRMRLFGLSFDNIQEIDTRTGTVDSFTTITPFRLLSLLPICFTLLFSLLVPTLLLFCSPVRRAVILPAMRSGRQPGLDVIRCLAVLAVIATHSMTGTSYYSQPFTGSFMFIFTFMRSFFICCVPLFMILSGFLLKKRTFGVAHYIKILHVLLPYVTCCVIARLWQALFYGVPFSIRSLIDTVLFHELAWYIEMYIGFYLFVPLLNMIWDGVACQTKPVCRHLLLILLFISITSLCTVTDNYISNYWESLYPVTYYFIGCFFGTYRIEISKKFQLLLISLLSVLYTLFMWHFMDGSAFNWASFGGYSHGYNALPTMLLAASLFLFFQNVSPPGKYLPRLFTRISSLSLEFYLVSSAIVDPLLLTHFDFRSLFHLYNGFGYFLWLIPYLALNISICFLLSNCISLLVRFESAVINKLCAIIGI